MKKKTPQVTCSCTAYKFPHRIGGGACSASDWCESYKEIDGSCCQYCSCNNNSESSAQGERFNTCDVISELEGVKLCDGFQDYLHSQTSTRLPMSLDAYLADSMVDDRFDMGACY